jgi:PAS domain S-box-containing protein
MSEDRTPSEDYFRRLLASAAVAMIATDAEGKIVFCNDEAAGLLGIDRQATVGSRLETLVPAQRRGLFARFFRRALERGASARLDVPMSTPDGRQRELGCIMSPVPAPDGQLAGVALWIVDETRRRELSQADRFAALETICSGVAHHFNNIFAGVTTFADFALASDDPTAMKRALQMTSEAASRASEITGSLLAFARQDVLPGENLSDLTEAVMTFAHAAEDDLAGRGVAVELNIEPVPVLEVESGRMNRVLRDLLANAVDAMPSGGTVRIGLSDENGCTVLTFADTGRGIPRSQLQSIFEPFFTTKGTLAGGRELRIGLGLSVVRGIVGEMGGRMEVDSAPGQGTRFTITFDRAAV